MTFVSTDPSSHQSENTWFTPKYLIDCLGPFDLDPCTVSYRPYNTAIKHIERDLGGDGLAQDWDGFVWMNPPYGKEIGPFIEKFLQHNNGISLVFARTGTPWIQNWLKQKGTIFLLRYRIKFIRKNGVPSTNAGADSCLLCAGPLAIERVKNSGLEGVFISLM